METAICSILFLSFLIFLFLSFSLFLFPSLPFFLFSSSPFLLSGLVEALFREAAVYCLYF